jgi:AraC family transcriptional regulator
METCERPIRSATAGDLKLCLLPPGPYRVAYTPGTRVAGFAFESQHGVHAFASDRNRPFHAQANGLAFTAAGCSIY